MGHRSPWLAYLKVIYEETFIPCSNMAFLFSIHEHEAIVCGGTANGGVVQLWVRWNGKPSIWEGGTSFHCLGERLGDCDLSPLHSGVSWRVSSSSQSLNCLPRNTHNSSVRKYSGWSNPRTPQRNGLWGKLPVPVLGDWVNREISWEVVIFRRKRG